MPLPRGFIEIHPLEEPPFVHPLAFSLGALVKYRSTRETVTGAVGDEQALVSSGVLVRTGAGELIHEFTSRSGLGLPFKLYGSPALNSRLCAVKPGWLIWLQHAGEDSWQIGAAYDLVKVRDLQLRMPEMDDELDRAILTAAGAYSAGTRRVGIEDIDSPGNPVPLSTGARAKVERLKNSQLQHRARAFLRQQLAIGCPPIQDVRHAFEREGFTVEHLFSAVEQLGPQVCLSARGKGSGERGRRHLRLPGAEDVGTRGMRLIASRPEQVLHQIQKDIEAERLRELEDWERTIQAAPLPDKTDAATNAVTTWLRELLTDGPRRLADIRREIPTDAKVEQPKRDALLVTACQLVRVTLSRQGPGKLRGGYWLYLAKAAHAPAEVSSLITAIRAEGSPHVPYPNPRAWF